MKDVKAMMNTTGRLFVFEGPDGVGKSYLSLKLLEHLRQKGRKCQLHQFPGKEDNSLGALVYKLHHNLTDCGVKQITPASLQVLHVAAHIDLIQSRIFPELESGFDIVLDRYWWSTHVYGIVSGIPKNQIQSLLGVELAFWGDVRPHILFHVSRIKPLRNEPSDLWPLWVAEYSRLTEQESSHYKVIEIANNDTPEKALATVFMEVDSIDVHVSHGYPR